MDIIPAIDLRGGNVVRLYQGDYEQETVFSDDPLGVAQRWQAEGGQRLHIVDLDGAHTGNPANLVAIAAITGSLTIPVQVGGGIRSAETAAGLFDAGADRVVVGTAAVSNPQLVEELCRRFGSERVVVALDARDGLVAIRGWTETSEITATDLAARMADLGVQRLLYTDISRDGTLEEPNYAATADLVRDSGLHVLSAGGVGAPEHVARLAPTGAEAAIIGRALYTGDVTIEAALAAANGL
jgi:phosphoribosylformimino-5-aminoimidazole carboxamide ribotide isomerase